MNIYSQIKYEEMTPDFQFLADSCGIEIAQTMLEKFGGLVFYVPKTTTSQVYGPYYDYNVKYGNSYTYRLKMIDKDGTSSHSQERVVSLKGEAGTLTVVSVGPNPSKDKSELRLNLGSTMPLTIELYDMAGNQVKTIYTGSQVSGESRYEINVNGLSSGIYNIVVRSGEIQIIEPLSVVR